MNAPRKQGINSMIWILFIHRLEYLNISPQLSQKFPDAVEIW